MINFEYLEPKTLKEAVDCLKEYGEDAKIKASGVSLLLLLKQGFFTPKYLVNILKIEGLDYIKKDENGNLLIGALTRHCEIEQSDLINKEFYVLAEMESDLGSVQIRNRGTIGGCICHGDPLIDPPSVLVAIDGRAKVIGPNGYREILFSDFFIGYYETALMPDEILTEIIIPKIPVNAGCAYIKHTMRKAMDKPFVGVTAYLEVDKESKTCKDVRIILGAISPRPVRAFDAEKLLTGKKLTPEIIKEIFSGYELPEMEFSYDIRCPDEYKKWTTPVIMKRAVSLAFDRAVK